MTSWTALQERRILHELVLELPSLLGAFYLHGCEVSGTEASKTEH
jgi:hypothetical protein